MQPAEGIVRLLEELGHHVGDRADLGDAAHDLPGRHRYHVGLPMPLQNLLVSEAHQRLSRSGQPDVVAMPAGQIVGRITEVRPVADVMAELLQEADDTLSRLHGLR